MFVAGWVHGGVVVEGLIEGLLVFDADGPGCVGGRGMRTERMLFVKSSRVVVLGLRGPKSAWGMVVVG
jgi:hypothetical protein